MLEVAKTAGFCFGVKRAVERAYACAADGGRYCTLGPIIHNRFVVDDLAARGVPPVGSIEEVPPGTTVLIRAHGVSPAQTAELTARGIPYLDLTCPYVAKIHRIAAEQHALGRRVVIIGDAAHPEVRGIAGWCEGSAVIVGSEAEAEALPVTQSETAIVTQTTFHQEKYKKIINILKKTCNPPYIFDTICKATEERQQEAEALAKRADVMLVLGDPESSNTRKLYEICQAACPRTYLLEHISDLPADVRDKLVGMTAGASTPSVIIKEAVSKMENMENLEPNVAENETAAPAAETKPADQSFESLFEESLKTINTGDVVKGTVIEVRPNEVILDLGVKQDGFIPAGEISDNPDLLPSDVVKVGDVIDVFVVRVNDAEGNIMLSKRKLDSVKTWNDVVAAYESGEVLTGKVVNVVGGGVIAKHKDVKVFIPASQCSDRYLADLNVLLGQEVSFKVIDINEKRRRVVGSVKVVLQAQREELEKKFWESAEIGKKYTGVVKSITNFGAFVDLGGVDGLVHISELSWKRIKHPSEVVKEGDTIEVYIKDIAEDTKKISLGFKKAEDNPWVLAQNQIHVGDVIKVKIVRMMPFGAFAEIMPSVDGLIHISQIANKRIGKPQDELEIGQEVDVKVVEVDWENHKIGLSIRALLPEEPVEAPVQAAEEKEPEPEHKEELGATIGDAFNLSHAAEAEAVATEAAEEAAPEASAPEAAEAAPAEQEAEAADEADATEE